MKKSQPKKEKRQYAKAKKAFDSVMSAYRNLMVITVSAVNVNGGSKGSTNPAKPTPTDFRCDVERAVKLRLKGATEAQFLKAYIEFDSEDSIEQEVHAQKVIGSKRHSIEQRLGAEFLRRKLYPIQNGYFRSIR